MKHSTQTPQRAFAILPEIAILVVFLFVSTPMAEGQGLDQAKTLRFQPDLKKITFDKNGAPLDYHSVFGQRWQHLQDMLRLPDYNGKKYYMGTYSQNCSATEGGMVFVAELASGNQGKVVWYDVLDNLHASGGFNHPGDLRFRDGVVVIAGQNWNGDGISGFGGRTFGDTFNKCKGDSEAVLFYDVSNPKSPSYMGKIDSYEKDGVTHTVKSEVDKLQIVSSHGSYHLFFNAIGNTWGWRLKSQTLSPHAQWTWVDDETTFSASVVDYLNSDGVPGYAAVSVEDDRWLRYGANTGKTTFERVPETSFGDGTSVNLTTQRDGTSYVVYANVESDDRIEIEEIESERWSHPITDLYILIGKNASPPSGYEKIPVDLNAYAGGDDLFLCYTRDPAKGSPITSIKIKTYGDKPDNLNSIAPNGHHSIRNNKNASSYDLNQGAGGDYIYMFYSRTQGSGPITSIDILVGEDTPVKGSWKKISTDLNKGAGGDWLNLIYTRKVISRQYD